jgi:xylan 1,4-beta-xylosidase
MLQQYRLIVFPLFLLINGLVAPRYCSAQLTEGPLAKTYINPLPLPDYPLGNWTQKPSPNLDRWLKGFRHDFRELADPSVIYDNGQWIMYPSVEMAYVSKDFITWTHHPVSPGKIGDGYAPTVVKYRNRYLMTGCFAQLFASDNPFGPFTTLGPIRKPTGEAIDTVLFDPMLFADDDGKLYLYYHSRGQLLGTRLNADDPTKMETVPKELARYQQNQEWERYGEYNEDPRRNFMEGVWVFKDKSTYYLTFTAPGTATGTYAIGAYKSQQPLAEFVYQDNNPVLRKTTGVVPGSGHGSIVRGPNNTLWAFVTSVLGNYHVFERRIGLFPVGINDKGELFADAARDIPQQAPGLIAAPAKGNDAGWLPVSVRTIARASSVSPGRTADYAIDDNARTWWLPHDSDSTPELTVDLKTIYDVAAVRILWSEDGLDHEKKIFAGPVKYRVFYQPDRSDKWIMALDCSTNEKDLLIDYRPFNTVTARRIKLQIISATPGIQLGVQEFTVFGKAPGKGK